MAAESFPHVELNLVGDSIPHSRLRWPQTCGTGKHRSSSTVGRLRTCEKAATTVQSRSIILDCIEETLERLERGLVFVRPETVTGWQRQRFKRYWWRLSQSKRPGRPQVYLEIRRLVRTMAAADPIWGAPRIHGRPRKWSSRNE